MRNNFHRRLKSRDKLQELGDATKAIPVSDFAFQSSLPIAVLLHWLNLSSHTGQCPVVYRQIHLAHLRLYIEQPIAAQQPRLQGLASLEAYFLLKEILLAKAWLPKRQYADILVLCLVEAMR